MAPPKLVDHCVSALFKCFTNANGVIPTPAVIIFILLIVREVAFITIAGTNRFFSLFVCKIVANRVEKDEK